MPRQLYGALDNVDVVMSLVRTYLRNARVQSAEELMDDALGMREEGARLLLSLLLKSRVNPRTRRSLANVRAQWLEDNRRQPGDRRAKWYSVLLQSLWGMFRAYKAYALPLVARHDSTNLVERLRRATRRELGWTGAFKVDLPSLSQRAGERMVQLMRSVKNQQVLFWVDNWYAERYGVNPVHRNLSRDVTAMAVLLLSSTDQAVAQSTRSRRWASFPGHVTLHSMTLAVDRVAHDVADSLRSLARCVAELQAVPLQAGWIRVPLDQNRTNRRSLQWQAWGLSQNRVSSTAELVEVLQELKVHQGHVGGVTPVLVDEKIHYSVMRLMYSPMLAGYDMVGWMKDTPLLYGVWHPYKQTLALVHRHFFPLFALLELTGAPVLGAAMKVNRKVMYLEKVFGSLLLLGREFRAKVQVLLRQQWDPTARKSTVDCTDCQDVLGEVVCDMSRHHTLLFFLHSSARS